MWHVGLTGLNIPFLLGASSIRAPGSMASALLSQLLPPDVDGDTLGQLGAWQHAWQRLQEQQEQQEPAAVAAAKASDGGSSSIKAGGGSHERPALLPVRAGLAVVSAAAIVLGGGLLAIKGMRRR